MFKHHQLMYGKKLVSYSQNGEDIRLYGYFINFEKPGFYVDVGANHPINDSVTKFFSLRGWKGINVEPQQNLCKLIAIDRPKDINLAVGLSDKREKLTLRKYPGDGLSTFSNDHKTGYELAQNPETNNYTDIKQSLLTLKEVLSKYGNNEDINFLKVDVEGFEYKVLKGNDWKKFRPWVICVESTGQDKRWLDILKKANYTLHLHDGLNSYFVAKEHSEIMQSYRALTVSEFIRYDILNTLPIRSFGIIGATRRYLMKPFTKLFNSD